MTILRIEPCLAKPDKKTTPFNLILLQDGMNINYKAIHPGDEVVCVGLVTRSNSASNFQISRLNEILGWLLTGGEVTVSVAEEFAYLSSGYPLKHRYVADKCATCQRLLNVMAEVVQTDGGRSDSHPI